MASMWFVDRGGEERGPLTAQQLKAMAAGGDVLPSDLVRRDDAEEWRLAGGVKGLFDGPVRKQEPTPPEPPGPKDEAGESASPDRTTRIGAARPQVLECPEPTGAWYVGRGGKGFGPFSSAQLRQLAECGLLEPTDPVWRDGPAESSGGTAVPAGQRPHLGLWVAVPGLALLTGAVLFAVITSLPVTAPASPGVPSGSPEDGEVSPGGPRPAPTTQTGATKREGETAGAAAVRPAPPVPTGPAKPPTEPAERPSNAADILALVDPVRDSVRGRWARAGGGLRCEGGGTLALPAELPDQFELRLGVRWVSGRTGVQIGVNRPGLQVLLLLDHWENTGLELVDGKRRADNATYHKGKLFQPGKESEVVYRAGRNWLTCEVDGAVVTRWWGASDRLSMGGTQKALGAPPGKVCLSCDDRSVCEVTRIGLRAIDSK